MMSEQDLVEIVQIAVGDLNHEDHDTDTLENHEEGEKPERKRARLESSNQDTTLKSMLVSISQAICQRLDNMESKLQVLEATCRALEEKLDTVMGKSQGPIQVPMVAGSPFGATQTCDKVRCVVPQTNVVVSSERSKTGQEEPLPRATESLENLLSNTVGRGRQKTIVLKVPGPEESQDDHDSGSDASDSVSNSGQAQNNNVTLITLNSEEDYPAGTWLGDENNAEMRVRCPVSPADMLHISSNCRTPEKMALTLLDYLFHREVQAVSNLSGQGKHGKKQLDPLMIYGIRCHLFHKFGITESDWYRIKQSIDSKCRTAWRRKQRGQSLAVKSFSRRAPAARNSSEGVSVTETASIDSSTQQALQYALAGAAQQVQIHRIGEDGQVQVIPQGHLHIAQVPQGEQVQITQDSEGNLQIHQVHVGQDGQVLRGPQLIAVASADGTGTVEASPLQGNDIQVQYVQLGPVTDHTGTVQAEALGPALQAEMEVKEAVQIQQGENGEVVQIQMPVNTVGT